MEKNGNLSWKDLVYDYTRKDIKKPNYFATFYIQIYQ